MTHRGMHRHTRERGICVSACGGLRRRMSFRSMSGMAAVVLLLAGASATSAATGTAFTVDTSDGTTDGICGGTSDCSLGDAIRAANANPGKDTIAFDLPSPLSAITPATELPTITDPVEIDATTQAGFVDRPVVELSGEALPTGSRGLRLLAGDSLVRGLVVNGFSFQIAIEPLAGNGNRITGSYLGTDVGGTTAVGQVGGAGVHVRGGANHLIGGPTVADRNVISGNGNAGIEIAFGAGAVTIQGNYIGTNATGTASVPGGVGSAIGVWSRFSPGPVVVGGAGTGEGNLISGNEGNGVVLGGGSEHEVVGNLIGTDASGEDALPNANGILTERTSDVLIVGNVVSGNTGSGLFLGDDEDTIVRGNRIGVDDDGLEPVPNGLEGVHLVSSSRAVIGGTALGAGNIISANDEQGIEFFNAPSLTRIEGNRIGLAADGSPLGNGFAGISCCGSPGTIGRNVIGGLAEGAGNEIAYNGFEGISVGTVLGSGPQASILGNSIYANGGLGIDLKGSAGTGPTPNDGGDGDGGPNDAQNFPVVTHVSVSGGNTLADLTFDSTPETGFRLELFRNASCNERSAAFPLPWFFGEGQTLVGVREITSDANGDWSGTVTLAGETGATEVITATATRFTEPSPSLVGATSELSECLADLELAKSDNPDPVAVGAALTYTIDVVNRGPAPAADVRVTDTLPTGVSVTSITPSQGTCTSSPLACALGPLARDGTASITIVVNPGTTPRTLTNTARVSSELRDPDESDNSDSEATRLVAGGTIVVRKESDPDGSPQTFDFTGAVVVTLSDGQSRQQPVAPGTYTVSETVPAGWDATSITCEDPSGGSSGSAVPVGPGGAASATFGVAAGETVTCTFTNTKRGSVTVRKTTDGDVDPARDISFVLSGPGLPAAGVGRSTFGDQDGVLEWPPLVPGRYTVCESPVPSGFTSFWKLDGVIVTPSNPDASRTPPEDLGNRCYDFTVAPGQSRAFEVDNSRPGGEPRTSGYWRNWNDCTGGNQSTVARRNGGAAEGFFLVEDLLPHLVGDLSVSTCRQAVRVLAKQDQAGRSKASDAAYELAAQLLAASFNLGAGAKTCAGVQQAALQGQTLLDTIGFTGSGDLLGSKSKSTRRPQALALAATLDRYNNGALC